MLIVITYLIDKCIKDNCDVRMLKQSTATPAAPHERESQRSTLKQLVKCESWVQL